MRPIRLELHAALPCSGRRTDPESTLRFLTEDERGRRFGGALTRVITQLRRDREATLEEARIIADSVVHASAIIARELGPKTDAHLYEVTDVVSLIGKAIKLSAGSLDEASVRLHTELPELPVVYADSHSLLHVFINLLKNAGQAILRRGPAVGDIHVHLARSASDHDPRA
jgi:signal transduction histidine kinase